MDEAELPPASPGTRWALPTRIAFRFCVLYFSLFCLLGYPQIVLALLGVRYWGRGPHYWSITLMNPVVRWTDVHVFGAKTAPGWIPSAGGDTTYYWVLVCCLAVVAAAGTVGWSLCDRCRRSHIRLNPWFRLLIRFFLAGQMFFYGLSKAFPLQMPAPSLSQLLMPVGANDRMQMLWLSMGASHPYEIATGIAEIVGGALLVLPRTTTLGALVCAVDMTQVFILNMTYDVPVKILSFHLLLMSLLLLAPEVRRLLDVFVFNRPVGPSTQAPLFVSRRANWIALVLQIALACWSFGWAADVMADNRSRVDAQSPLYGVWNVDTFEADGATHPPLTTDQIRWQRVTFDQPWAMSDQRADGSIDNYLVQIDQAKHRIVVVKPGAADWRGSLVFQRPAIDRLILDGVLGGHRAHLELDRIPAVFPLTGPAFHWIQDGQIPR